jgi:hypothetical protein
MSMQNLGVFCYCLRVTFGFWESMDPQPSIGVDFAQEVTDRLAIVVILVPVATEVDGIHLNQFFKVSVFCGKIEI